MKPFLDYLALELGHLLEDNVTISIQMSSDYEESIQALADGEVDFLRFGPASYVTAKLRNHDVEILAIEAVKGLKTFHGIIAVHKNSEIQSLSELTGRSFAFGNRLSTIGRFLAQGQLLDAGQTSETLGNQAYLGRHDRVGAAVGSGEFDAGALKESTYKKLLAKNVPLKAVSRFENVTKPWIARANLDPAVTMALRQLFLEATDPDILKSLKVTGFLEGEDNDYDVIRKAMLKSQQFGG